MLPIRLSHSHIIAPFFDSLSMITTLAYGYIPLRLAKRDRVSWTGANGDAAVATANAALGSNRTDSPTALLHLQQPKISGTPNDLLLVHPHVHYAAGRHGGAGSGFLPEDEIDLTPGRCGFRVGSTELEAGVL